LVIFNRLAGSADEMGTFIKNLACIMRARQQEYVEAKNALEGKEADLRKSISRLELTEQQKTELQKQFDELKESKAAFKNIDLAKVQNITLDLGLMFGTPLSLLLGQKRCSKCGQLYSDDKLPLGLPADSWLTRSNVCPQCAQG